MEILPTAISYGISYDDFWQLTPHSFHIITRGHLLKMQYDDKMNWIAGQYVLRAVQVAVEHCFSGKKARSEYIKEPLLADYIDDMYMTQEERDEKELRKMIASEEAWIRREKQMGLKETYIKELDNNSVGEN